MTDGFHRPFSAFLSFMQNVSSFIASVIRPRILSGARFYLFTLPVLFVHLIHLALRPCIYLISRVTVLRTSRPIAFGPVFFAITVFVSVGFRYAGGGYLILSKTDRRCLNADAMAVSVLFFFFSLSF